MSCRFLLLQLSSPPRKAFRFNKSPQYLQASPKRLEMVLLCQQRFENENLLKLLRRPRSRTSPSWSRAHVAETSHRSQDIGLPPLECTRIQVWSPLENLLSPLQYEDRLLVSVVGSYPEYSECQEFVNCFLYEHKHLPTKGTCQNTYIFLYSPHCYQLWPQGITHIQCEVYCSWRGV